MDTQNTSFGQSCYQQIRCEEQDSSDDHRMDTVKRNVEEQEFNGHGRVPLSPSMAASSWRRNARPSTGNLLRALIVLMFFLTRGSHAAFISTFNDCLSPNIINSSPKQLQLTPYWVWAFFDSVSPSHSLNVTIYGNVAGQATQGFYPPSNDSQWNNPNETLGKIVDISKATDIYTTLQAQFNVLDYTPYSVPATRFCNTTVQGKCPIAPNFAPNA